ncbi:hypothetical protein DOCECA_17910 [Pseudomonas sp. E102]
MNQQIAAFGSACIRYSMHTLSKAAIFFYRYNKRSANSSATRAGERFSAWAWA